MRRLLLVAAVVLAVPPGAATAAGLPAPPRGWPHRLEIGVADPPGGAPALRRRAPLGFRYEYLAGGANTGQGGATGIPTGTSATRNVTEPAARARSPASSTTCLLQSSPPAAAEPTL